MVVVEDLQIVDKTVRARSCTAVEPIAICLFAGPIKLPVKVFESTDNKCSQEDETDPNKPTLVRVHLDKWLHIVMEEKNTNNISKFRQEVNSVPQEPKIPKITFI